MYPKHVVEVVILRSIEVEQEGLHKQPGVDSQPQHLNNTVRKNVSLNHV